MLSIESSLTFDEYLQDKRTVSDLEKWIYSNGQLEIELPGDIYSDLISLNYSDKDIKNKITQTIESSIDYSSVHKKRIIDLIDLLLNRKGNVEKLLHEIYSLAGLGYHFLGRIDVIGNLGEQGKSIIHIISKLTEQEKWDKLFSIEPTFLNDIREMKNKLLNGDIEITGQFETGLYGQRYFIFTEKTK
jgi:hypothetical protein